MIRPARRPARAATAAGGGGSGAGGTRRPRSIALAAAARMLRGGVEVAPAELLTQYSAQQQVRGVCWRPVRAKPSPCSLLLERLVQTNGFSSPKPFSRVATAHLLSGPHPLRCVQAAAHTSGRSFVLPLLVFPLPELPTDTLTLPVQEDCYRRM